MWELKDPSWWSLVLRVIALTDVKKLADMDDRSVYTLVNKSVPVKRDEKKEMLAIREKEML